MTDPAPAPDGRYVRVGEAARLVGLASRDILRRIDDGVLTARRNADGMIVVSAEELDAISR